MITSMRDFGWNFCFVCMWLCVTSMRHFACMLHVFTQGHLDVMKITCWMMSGWSGEGHAENISARLQMSAIQTWCNREKCYHNVFLDIMRETWWMSSTRSARIHFEIIENSLYMLYSCFQSRHAVDITSTVKISHRVTCVHMHVIHRIMRKT